jgi:group I intron endonuclease
MTEWRSGVYCWLNRVNGKRYVGSASKSLLSRLRGYRKVLRKGKCHNRYFLRAWLKHGSRAFVFQVLERCPPEECLVREQFWLNHYRAAEPKFGYNICPTAGSTLGLKFGPLSERQRVEISQRMMGNQHFVGKTPTPETRAKLSALLKGKKPSPEAIARSRAVNTGKKLSAETRAKMSDSRTGHPTSLQTRERISQSLTGKPLSAEHRAKLSAIRKGRKLTEVTKARMSAARRGVPWGELRRAAEQRRRS